MLRAGIQLARKKQILIFKMLDVRAILEGSVRKAGNRLRDTAQLIDAGAGLHLWWERFDREERDAFDIQDEISLAIVDHLRVTLLAGEKTALRKRSTADTEAYNLYLKGLYFLARPNPESIQKALNSFHEALDRDPNFALARDPRFTAILDRLQLNANEC